MQAASSVTCSADSDLERVAEESADLLLGGHVSLPPAALTLVGARLKAALDYHREKFGRAWNRTVEDAELLDCLRRGEFAVGRRADYDLVTDIVLAGLLEAGVSEAFEAFTRRFGQQVAAWGRRFAADDPQLPDDLLADLVLPRAQSGPRIASYKGFAPMDGWLRQVVMSQAQRRRDARGLVLDPEPAESAPATADSCDLNDDYARMECTEKLAPALAGMFDKLEATHRLVLQMSILDGVEQKQIADLLGVRDYKVTRIKQEAIRKAAQTFYDFARRVGLKDQTVHDCVQLILDRFPDGLAGELNKAGGFSASPPA